MAEGGEVPKDDTDENTGARNRDFNSSREMNEMLNDLGLSEESITVRRHRAKLMNIDINFGVDLDDIVCYYSGSFAEGLVGMYEETSDIDMMMIEPLNIIQSANELNPQHRFPLNNGVYALEDSISQPLFKRLRHITGGDNRMLYQHQNGYFYLSNSEMKRNSYFLMSEIKENFGFKMPTCAFDICGPSVNMSFHRSPFGYISDFDMVVTVPCPFWPRDINEWFVRERRYQWPSLSNIHSIKRNGCLLVGKGFNNSTEYEIEWRISFSIAETVLIKSFNSTQMKCYYLMKTLLKRVLKPIYPNVLCSYHMKTVLFWVCEETCPTFFKENALIDCFHLCLNKLRFFLLQKHCPCYFRRDINLLSNHLGSTEYIQIVEFLYDLTQQGVADLLKPYLRRKCPLNLVELVERTGFCDIYLQPWYFESIYKYVNSIKNEDNAIKIQSICIRSISELINVMFNLLELDFDCLKILSNSVAPDLSCIALAALFKRQKNNKDHYRLQKHYISLMSRDLSVESSTGVLKRATVYYKIGKINECMVLVVNIMDKITSTNVLYSCTDADRNSISKMFWGFVSTDASIRSVPNITFSPLEMALVPEFICHEMDVEKTTHGNSTKGWAFIDSIIYAYCLAILCQHYISDFNTRDDFLQQLRELYLKRKIDLCYPESAKRAINYFYERFRIP